MEEMAKNLKEIEKQVIEILADKLDIDSKKIKPESKLAEDLGMDSFGAVEFSFELKDKFKIEIPQEDFSKIKVVKDIVQYISNYITER